MRDSRSVLTPRLLLRPFQPADVPAYAAIRARPEVMRFLPGGEARAATAEADAERLVPIFQALWDSVGYGPWAVVERATGMLRGHLGLRRIAELGDQTEILYMLDSAVWGRGLASEGAAAARDYGVGVVGLTRLIGLALPDNAASIAVLRRVGMQPEGAVHAFGVDLLQFGLHAPVAGSAAPPPPHD